MKMMIKLISLLLVTIITVTVLFSCASKLDTENGSDANSNISSEFESGSDQLNYETDVEENYTPTVDASKFPENAFPIFDGAAYTVKVINSNTANALERQVATTLRSELKKKTKTTF